MNASSTPAKSGPRELACARCGAAFTCNLEGPCWCGAETARLPLPIAGATGFDDCLCRDCLRSLAAAHTIRPENEPS